MSNKFWNWIKNGDNTRTLYLEGVLSEETWYGDEATPRIFKSELHAGTGDIVVWINSAGGDVFAAAQIYNMLKEYSGKVTVKIDGLAASAASVVAMAGDEILMSPVSCLMIHNPSTIAIGDGEEMLRAKALLDEIKESILNAYEAKTGLSRGKLSQMMDAESWMNARKAVDLGFADGILYGPPETQTTDQILTPPVLFSRAAVVNSLYTKLSHAAAPKRPGTPAEALYTRLGLILH